MSTTHRVSHIYITEHQAVTAKVMGHQKTNRQALYLLLRQGHRRRKKKHQKTNEPKPE